MPETAGHSADAANGASSPPKGLTHSPSIFAYQQRILQRTSSVRTGTSISLLASPEKGSTTAMTASPPSTPIRQSVSKMMANMEDQKPPARGTGVNAGSSGHRRGAQSVGEARNLWQSKINDAAADNSAPLTPRSRKVDVSSPPLQASSTFSSVPSPPIRTPTALSGTTDSAPASGAFDGARRYGTPSKRSTISGMDGFDLSKGSESPATGERIPSDRLFRTRPASISSATSLVTPQATGSSSTSTGRTQEVDDALARARANALQRLEARKRKGQATPGAPSTPASESAMPPPSIPSFPSTPSAFSTISVTSTPSLVSTPITAPLKSSTLSPASTQSVTSVPIPSSSTASATKFSSLSKMFEPPTPSCTLPKSNTILAPESTPTSSSTRSSYRSIVTPPSAPAPRYVPSGLSSTVTPKSGSSGRSEASSLSNSSAISGPSTSGSDKYGSISRGDNRRLGRHLPRIASGGEGWDEEEAASRKSGRRVPSTLGRDDSVVLPSFMGETSASPQSQKTEPLGTSITDNIQTKPVVPSTPSAKRRSYVLHTPKEGLTTPRAEVAGEEMKGLMNAVGSLPSRGMVTDDSEGVTGMTNRLRLSRSALPPSASSRTLAPAPLPSKRLVQSNWMDRQRHALAAYEYLCHVGEAQQWIEGCLGEETGFGVTEMEEGLRNGVVLAKLARAFQGENVVKRIWTDSKHRYKQTDNIDAFLKFLATVGMPLTFTFDPIDLYEKKNIPKVIFCIHVLSHLLAKQGLAERIGNLVGQFEFTDEQLAATQKGLQGVAMPNFGDARKTLAKEASWEPELEEPEETEDERRDRELLDCQDSIIKLQQTLRGRLACMRVSRTSAQLDLALPVIKRFQARSRGALSRQRLVAERDQQDLMHDWATGLQCAAKRAIAIRQHDRRVESVRSIERTAVNMQAQARRVLANKKKAVVSKSLDTSARGIIAFQAACRACLAKRAKRGLEKTMGQSEIASTITAIQAVARGRLHRQREAAQLRVLETQTATYTSLQSQIRAALVRRKHRAREERLDDANANIVAIQAAARGLLARQKKRSYVQHLQTSLPVVSSFQAAARARLARQTHANMQKALAKVEVAGSVGGLQAFLRTRLAKKQTTEQKKKLEFVQPDVIGFQALARGYLARQEYREWRDYLQDPHTQGALVFLQSLIRGFNARRRLWLIRSHYYRNVDKIVKIQALYRGRTERQLYDRLLTGVQVDVPTIQNYMHLLDDTDADYQRQIRTETLRREVVRLIRENQTLETEVKELDTKIALILKNKMTFEELARAKHRARDNASDEATWKDSATRDPFTSAHLDRNSQRKLELFEYLFFILQTKGEYLSRLLFSLANDESKEADLRLIESVTLSLFGYGQEKREDYLFHKLLQISVHEEVLRSKSLDTLLQARFGMMGIATQYVKTSVTPFLQSLLVDHVLRVINASMLDLSTDPAEIYRRCINEEESRTGVPSDKPRDLDGNQVLQLDETSRALYIQHLQELRHLTKELLEAIYRSVPAVPYTIRLLAREALLALRVKYPEALDEELTPAVAKNVILPFILPAIIAPEMYGICEPGSMEAMQRRNLAAIVNLVIHVAEQDFVSSNDHFVRTPLKEYIWSESATFRDWVLDVASVEPLETTFGADELLENTVEPKPIMITRAEIYGTLAILIKNVPIIAPGKTRDSLAAVLEELEGPPIDYDKSKTTVTVRLTNRLVELESTGPDELQKQDWVQAKRHVLAVLRVQTGKTLFEVLVNTPTQEHEQIWIELVHQDIMREEQKRVAGGLAPTPVEKEYQIQSIRSLPFHEVKSRAIEFCMKLERAQRLSRDDQFEGLLVSIASDIRQKHHLRKMQRQNAVAMERAHDDMRRKHTGYEEQIKSYHQFIDSSMASLQKGKKKPTFLSKQYFHQRSEAKSGKKSKFGTYKYTAADLYTRGILLGINQLSPNVFNEVHIVLASNEVGVFSLELSSSAIPSPLPSANGSSAAIMSREELRMEDLLQAQFENELNLLAFEGMATFSINMLIHQINKKFYSAS